MDTEPKNFPSDALSQCDSCLSKMTERTEEALTSFKNSSDTWFKAMEGRAGDMFTSLIADHGRMRDSITIFMEEMGTKLNASKLEMEQSVEKDNKRNSAVARELAAIILGVVLFFCGYFLSRLDNMNKEYEALKSVKADKTQAISPKELGAIIRIRDAHMRQLFIMRPGAELMDTTNYNWIVKGILGGNLRGVQPIDNK